MQITANKNAEIKRLSNTLIRLIKVRKQEHYRNTNKHKNANINVLNEVYTVGSYKVWLLKSDHFELKPLLFL